MRLIEEGLVRLGLIQPTVKALADTMRDDLDTFSEHHAPDRRCAWLLHKSRVFSVVYRPAKAGSLIPRFRVIDSAGEDLLALRRLDRVLLAIAWPNHLRVRPIHPSAWYGEQFI
ncbi:hypothetical protein [Burkholderia vietnamiensis]|uniref:hypothetical protein n=1 Tax=Burkholderia vietnamiensis TaxID=60552 RepID=UPI001CB4768C|nr:hypothetical protein [Burkholderia vietnamiensis]CAG9229033.1 hypothetical protein BVI1335_70139 [Burkholderia vietnamiensis]HDR9086330.1 hypothetical protein [Burkholderia vietnamiensis]